MNNTSKFFVGLALLCAATITAPAAHADIPDRGKGSPLRVMLVPADTGANSIADDFRPVFNAITKVYGLHFDIKVGSSYAAVVQGMASEQVDIAWLGVVTLYQAHKLGAAEFLALDVKNGESIYYSGILVAKDSGINSLRDMKGKTVAFGDVNSTSGFNFPVAMMLGSGIDPARDFGRIVMAGSHTNSLTALREERVDAASISFKVYEKSVQQGIIDPTKFKVLKKSEPIPVPPLGMHTKLKPEIKALLKEAFNNVHKAPGIRPEQIRGYGGKQVDHFDADYPYSRIESSMNKLAAVTDDVKGAILKKAAER
ncbi:MAG: phosphonate ABC transporter substrate-binding protein [Magnetovibrio sp.]|nr:phosphonate ABC transporter substrate-binding protein [Magnetovibrio sp.]